VHCFVTHCFSYISVVHSEQTTLNLSHTVTEVWLTSKRGQKRIIGSRRTAVKAFRSSIYSSTTNWLWLNVCHTIKSRNVVWRCTLQQYNLPCLACHLLMNLFADISVFVWWQSLWWLCTVGGGLNVVNVDRPSLQPGA